MRMRQGRHTAISRMAAIPVRSAVVPAAPISGNRPFAMLAPTWKQHMAAISRAMARPEEPRRPIPARVNPR